jgi:hypothetical protein
LAGLTVFVAAVIQHHILENLRSFGVLKSVPLDFAHYSVRTNCGNGKVDT